MSDNLLQICPSPSFVWPFKITVAGEGTPATLRLKVARKTDDELKNLLAASLNPGIVAQIVSAIPAATIDSVPALGAALGFIERHARDLDQRKVVHALVLDWPGGPVDESGVPVPFSAAALDSLLSAYIPAAGEIVQQYIKAVYESRVKN